MPATKEEIGSLIDALYLEMLHLIEEYTRSRKNIERLSNSGQLLLAKTRYIQGTQTVSTAQIPTENGLDFKALCRVREKESSGTVSETELEVQREPVCKQNGYVEPMHWFGVLAPSSLREAAESFRKCVDLVVESANIQRELMAVTKSIEQLKKVKQLQSVSQDSN